MTFSLPKTAGFGLLAGLAILLLASVSPKTAAADAPAEACVDPAVSERQAMKITASVMRELGFTKRKVSPRAYFIRDARCRDGQWTVAVDVRQGNWIQHRAYVRIDCIDGKARIA